MQNSYTEANYENAVIEVFRDTLGMIVSMLLILSAIMPIRFIRMNCFPLFIGSIRHCRKLLLPKQSINCGISKAVPHSKRTSGSWIICKTAFRLTSMTTKNSVPHW